MKFDKTVQPIDFTRLSGHEFERLVFAFLWRRWRWSRLDWFGQRGDDGGRDIVGVREGTWGNDETVVVACANWQRLTITKARGDLDALVKASKVPGGPFDEPAHAIVVGGGALTAGLKTKVAEHAAKLSLPSVEVWSGPEFEEQLRFHADSVLKRFYDGEELPDEAEALKQFAAESVPTQRETMVLIVSLFDRPAFLTPFRMESSLPDFRRAISDTIEALNTGICRTRDGTVHCRVPRRHEFAERRVRDTLKQVVDGLVDLRARFDRFLRIGEIMQEGFMLMVSPAAADALNDSRQELLKQVSALLPEHRFDPIY